MNMVQMVEQIELVVAETVEAAEAHAQGAGPEPDSELAALRILKILADAMKTDATFRHEILLAMGGAVGKAA